MGGEGREHYTHNRRLKVYLSRGAVPAAVQSPLTPYLTHGSHSHYHPLKHTLSLCLSLSLSHSLSRAHSSGEDPALVPSHRSPHTLLAATRHTHAPHAHTHTPDAHARSARWGSMGVRPRRSPFFYCSDERTHTHTHTELLHSHTHTHTHTHTQSRSHTRTLLEL